MNKYIASLCILCIAFLAFADDSQLELRLNPEIEETNEITPADYSKYKFLNLRENKINLNGRDWSSLAQKFAEAKAGNRVFSIVYLGDSHIQADFGGDILRHRLQEAAGNAGRGVIIPFKMAKTNQPLDYTINTNSPYISSKLLKQPWATEMPYTGVGIQPTNPNTTFTLSSKTPFNRMRIIKRQGEAKIAAVFGENVGIPIGYKDDGEWIYFDQDQTDIHARIETEAETVIGGFDLRCDSIGILVHSIGNNGATYSSYGMIDKFGSGISELEADLFIIALGTNEAYGRISPEGFISNVDNLISTIRNHCQAAEIMIVAPAESFRRIYRRRNGRRRSSTTVNSKISTLSRSLRLYAEKEHIPLYHHYRVAGGAGAASKMRQAHILSSDGIHYTSEGYRLWGNLLADAILQSIDK